MDEASDHQRRVEDARLQMLIAMTGERIGELAILLSAFRAVAESEQLEESGAPPEELYQVPDPRTLLEREEEMTTKEAVNILRDWLDMSGEGEARLWRLLGAYRWEHSGQDCAE